MAIKKFAYVKNRRKCKVLLLLSIVGVVVIVLVILHRDSNGLVMGAASKERLLDERFIARAYGGTSNNNNNNKNHIRVAEQSHPLLKSPQDLNGVIVPEKYDEHKIKARIIQEEIRQHKEQLKQKRVESGEESMVLNTWTNAVHIYYSAPVQWYKTRKPSPPMAMAVTKESLPDEGDTGVSTHRPLSAPMPRILNTAFYPALGLYKPTPTLMQQHFENIRSCGIGTLILSYTGKTGEFELYNEILDLAPNYNLSVTFEISVAGNQSVSFLRQQLKTMRKFSTAEGFYRVYSLSRERPMPVVYVSNAYKLSETAAERLLCSTDVNNLRGLFDGFFIGHIRLKNHAETMRRLCFDGFYSRLPSNGATFASTWKNWSYLKSFAITYKMLFVPTVGPGFAERNKFPRHGDIQRHRSNGRYYGVAWRTAILNHVGFITIASYNNWPDGSQIEEVIPRPGFLDYSPGSKTKYLDLTKHWVGNFLKNRQEAAAAGMTANNGQLSCYEYLNNTIC